MTEPERGEIPKEDPRATEPTKTSIFEEARDLRSLRDELRLQAHLMKAEVRERLDELESRWTQVETKLDALERESTDAARSVLAATRDLIGELRDQYRKLTKRDETSA